VCWLRRDMGCGALPCSSSLSRGRSVVSTARPTADGSMHDRAGQLGGAGGRRRLVMAVSGWVGGCGGSSGGDLGYWRYARGPAGPSGWSGLRRGLGEDGGGQPYWFVQGPDGAGDDRGRGGRRPAAAGPAGRGVHRREHRLVAGVRLRGEGLPVADRVLGCVRRGEDRHDAGVRRRGRADTEPGGHHARSDPVHDAQGRRDRGADRGVRHRSVP
jgi:hypothetical protein